MTPTDTECAWAAGIIDGEGCLTIRAREPVKPGTWSVSHSLFLKVTMGHKPTVERLAEMFGVGSVHMQDSRGERLNASWTWWVASRKAHVVLLAVRPYLVTKAHEADIGLEFLSGPMTARGRHRLPPEVVAERERLRILMRDAKPTARFRVPA